MSITFLAGGCKSDQGDIPPPARSDPAPKVAPSTNPTARGDSTAIATIAAEPITLAQLQAPLIEGYGLNVLLNIAQLDLAKKEAANAGVVVTPQDFIAERDLTLGKMFKDASKDEYPQLLDQFLQQQRVTKPEFDLLMQTNAYLRKMAEPKVKAQIGEKELLEAFNALYGESVQVRHIECANLQEIAEAKRRLAAGEKFEDVARAISRNARTAPLGGELPPFSQAAAGYPANFKDAAFALKEGDVSDAVAVGATYHLIKLDKRIAPRAIKFEDVKESVREEVTDRLMQATIAAMRQTLAAQTQASLIILDPVLKQQYEAKRTDADKQIKDRQAALKMIERDNARLNAESTTRPGLPITMPAIPTTVPSTAPATR